MGNDVFFLAIDRLRLEFRELGKAALLTGGLRSSRRCISREMQRK
jgi:hypothetical protein